MAPWRRRRPGRTRSRFLPLVATVNAARVLDAIATTDVAAPAVAVHEQHANRRDATAAWQQRPARPRRGGRLVSLPNYFEIFETTYVTMDIRSPASFSVDAQNAY